MLKALLLTATTGIGAAYDTVTIGVMNEGTKETDGLGQDSDTKNDKRGPVGLGIQIARNWLDGKKFDEDIQCQEGAQNSAYYIFAGMSGAHFGPNNVGFGKDASSALKDLYNISQKYRSGTRHMETNSFIDGLTKLKESLGSINAADNTLLNDQVDLLISKVDALTKIGTYNDLIDVSNDLQRIAETVVAFSILAGGGDGGTTAFTASIFKTVLATANLHWDNQINKHSDEYNREALEELKVNFEHEATPDISELFKKHSLNDLAGNIKATLSNRTLPHKKTEDRLTRLVPNIATPKVKHVNIIKIEHAEEITHHDIKIEILDNASNRQTEGTTQESNLEVEIENPQLKKESNYNKYTRLKQSLKSDKKLDEIKEKIDEAYTQKIFDWTDRLAIYEAVSLLEPDQLETNLENLINCRLSLVTTSGTNLNFISDDNKGVNQATFDKMHDELSLYKPYKDQPLIKTSAKEGLNKLKTALLKQPTQRSSRINHHTNREKHKEMLKDINKEAIDYAEKIYFQAITKKTSILQKDSNLNPENQALKTELQGLKEKLTQAPSDDFYNALTQFDFEVKKENARTEPINQKLTLHSSYKEFATINGIPLTMANRILKEHASSKLGKKLEGLLPSETIKSLQKKKK